MSDIMSEDFDADTKRGIQYVTECINDQAVIRGIRLDNIAWKKDPRGDKHVVESSITYHGHTADQWFTKEQLIHCKPGEAKEYKAVFDVSVKIESLFLHLGL
jgi:hypothetical protein